MASASFSCRTMQILADQGNDQDCVLITQSEYEALQRDSRRINAIRNRMSEFYAQREKIMQNYTDSRDQARNRARRIVINSISVILSGVWDG